MSAVAVKTWEENRGRVGQEKIDGVPLSIMATAALMAPTPSLAEEQPAKKRPAQDIGCGVTI